MLHIQIPLTQGCSKPGGRGRLGRPKILLKEKKGKEKDRRKREKKRKKEKQKQKAKQEKIKKLAKKSIRDFVCNNSA